jgi:hypothetical protein
VLEDLTRNASVHAAGVVIGDQPLVNLLPLKQDEDGTIVTQYAMDPVGDLGLLKMDFLGLKTLTVIHNSCEMVRRTQGIEVPIENLPLDDARTYDLLNKVRERYSGDAVFRRALGILASELRICPGRIIAAADRGRTISGPGSSLLSGKGAIQPEAA